MRICRFGYLVLCSSLLTGLASQLLAARGTQGIVSPEVHADRRVTFRLYAPRAKYVGVGVQFMPGIQPMRRDNNGLWRATLGPAEPDIYEYSFMVDGLQIVDPANSWLKIWLRTAKNLVEIPGGEPMFFEEQQVPHGTMHIHGYQSKSLGIARPLYVYTPPGYETNRQARYPVLYLLHGLGDAEDTWTVVARANLIVDNLLAKNQAKPLVIVMPYGHTPSAPPDMRSVGKYGDFQRDMIEDVIPYVQQCYRVGANQKDRAIAGLSMGGGQALTVGLGHLELFGWIGAFSSAVPRGEKLDELLAEPNSVNEKLKLFWVGCGRNDFLFRENQSLIDRLNAENIKHIGYITDGAHEWRLWRGYLNEFVPLLFRSGK